MHCTLRLAIVAGLAVAVAVALPGCASLGAPPGLAAGQTVAVVNSLSWDNPLTGKRDGVRTSWPVQNGTVAVEPFALAQLKQCDAGACAWGVMRAQRSAATLVYRPGGIDLSCVLDVDVARSQQLQSGPAKMSVTIPKDVAVITSSQQLRPALHLKYGKVEQVDLDYGVRYQVCVQRYDAAGKVIDRCEIPYI